MKINGFLLERQFEVSFKDKIYYVSYLNSTSNTLCLLNREYWEIYEEDGDNFSDFKFIKNKFILDKNKRKLKIKLIKHCIKNFNKYKPKYYRY